GPDQRRHHRPVRGPGRAVRARVRRPARQPLVRRRPGIAHLLRARPDGAATAARRLPGAGLPDHRRQGADVSAHGAARRGGDRRAGPRHRHAQPGEREAGDTHRRRRRARDRRLCERLLPLHQRQGLQRDRHLAGPQARRGVREPVLHADSPYLHPRHGAPPVQADADERVAPQRRSHLGAAAAPRPAPARPDSRERARLLPRAAVPELREPGARDIASRRAKEVCDEGRGVGPGGHGVYLDFQDAILRLGRPVIAERYGNLFEMYQRITAEDPYLVPMRIYPAPHYTMGGLWVDYNLMTTVEGLYAIGEANFSDHGANRLGASALMQGLADGYFILPYTIGDYLAQAKLPKVDAGHAAARQTETEVAERTRRLLLVNGRRSVDTFHRELGRLMWDRCGMSRNAAGLKEAIQRICVLREEFWQDVYVGGRGE